MDENNELLKIIQKICLTAINNLEFVISKSKDDKFLNESINQNQAFLLILSECKMILKSYELNMSNKKIETATSLIKIESEKPTTRQFATIIYLNTVNMVPEIIFAINDLKNANKDILDLATKLKNVLELNEQNIKVYLN